MEGQPSGGRKGPEESRFRWKTGESGYLVDSTEECIEKALYLLENPGEARRIGANGHKFVRDNNLMPRLIAQEMELLNSL